MSRNPNHGCFHTPRELSEEQSAMIHLRCCHFETNWHRQRIAYDPRSNNCCCCNHHEIDWSDFHHAIDLRHLLGFLVVGSSYLHDGRFYRIFDK
ncbi:hypothetical protein HanPSC8_Chr10g0436611 [Helianthus annuus]|nr:hypothetical protein HanPSC8_Chr10g0436611 [Helianthus annuus]